MKKIKIVFIFIIIILVLLLTNKVFAEEETTKLLYQDITINKDGSITIKEAAWLEGEYNGRLRDIDFKNPYATKFTGIYSNFTGNTDIYDGTGIENIKVYDISQENFKSIYDIGKEETVYEKVKKSSNGKYGVYELEEKSSGDDFKIYCPSDKKKVMCIEYTITDVVVVHNDIAELYWNVLGEYFEEGITDFKVVVHLPGEDDDVRIWTHGPLTGKNEIIDAKTLYFQDTNVEKYTPETIRIMFNKELVPFATKMSNINGRENILKYEQMMADNANSERIRKELELESRASEAVAELEEEQRMYYYNYALELVKELDETSEEKQNLLDRIEKTKDVVNNNWKENLDSDVEWLTDSGTSLNREKLDNFKEEIEEGFDEEAKQKYLQIYEKLEDILEIKNAVLRKTFITVVIIINAIIGSIAIYKLLKILSEKNKYTGKYYREFPNNDNPNVIEYLMKRKSTNIGFSATVLNLINKKVISYKKVSENSIELIYENDKYTGTSSEEVVLDVLFKMVGKDNKCKLNSLKNYGKTVTKAKKLIKKIDEFKKTTEEETECKDYFKNDATLIIYKIFTIINYVISILMTFGVFYGLRNCAIGVLCYLIGITLLNIVYLTIGNNDKNRTLKGKEEYSKWLAHKRFLEDFSNFDEKDLPEITLWEKYLVTATVLGVADKVEKRMKMYINDNNDNINTDLLIYRDININLTRQINNSVRTAINNSSINNYTGSSSYSSGGGFGGGSSGGGGRTVAGGGGGGRF